MFRNNPVGVVFLVLGGFMVVVMLWQIVTGERLRYTGPDWLAWLLLAVVLGGSIYALVQGKSRKQDQQWPNPNAGRRSLWDRIRGKDAGS